MTWLQMCWTAIAHSVAFGQGFQMTVSPARSREERIPAQTATN